MHLLFSIGNKFTDLQKAWFGVGKDERVLVALVTSKDRALTTVINVNIQKEKSSKLFEREIQYFSYVSSKKKN